MIECYLNGIKQYGPPHHKSLYLVCPFWATVEQWFSILALTCHKLEYRHGFVPQHLVEN